MSLNVDGAWFAHDPKAASGGILRDHVKDNFKELLHADLNYGSFFMGLIWLGSTGFHPWKSTQIQKMLFVWLKA